MRKARDQVVEWARGAAHGDNPALPAATVVLVRDGASGALETLMMRRDSRVAFGGMWVFPGGRIDDADRAGAEDELDAAARAAAREAREESGLVVDPADLAWISFWVPPPQAPRRFATWFFVAPAPGGDVVVDDGEIREHRWLTPLDVFAMRDDGEVELAPPTWVTLHWLAVHPDVAACMDAARVATPERFETRIAPVDGGAVALWESDAGYGTRDAGTPGARHRLWLLEEGWRYERS